MCALFKVSKPNKKSKFINSSLNEYSQPTQNVVSPSNNQDNSTFVYDSVPKDNMYNQNYMGGYSNNGNQGYVDNSNYNNMNSNYDNMNTNYSNGNINYQNNEANSYGNYSQHSSDVPSNEMPVPKAAALPKNEVSFTEYEDVLEVEELELPDKKEQTEDLEALDETVVEPQLDPLNNANNPIPVNPVAPKEEVVEEELPEDVKANLFSAIGMMFGMIVKPGTTIIKNSKRYRSISKALVVTLWISVLSIILCMAARIVVGMFHVNYNSVTGQAAVSLNFVNMFDLENYTPYLLVSFIMSFGAICIASLVYYASSFLNSKGVHMGTYFMVSCLAMVPVIMGVLVVYPIINVFSPYIALFVFVFTLLYTLISFYIGMNEVLKFKSVDKRILYNVINLSLIFIIIVVVFLICFRLNILVPPEFHL